MPSWPKADLTSGQTWLQAELTRFGLPSGTAWSGITLSAIPSLHSTHLSRNFSHILGYTVKSVKNCHSKIEKTKSLMTNGSLMKVESIAECSPWSILQYFWPALSDNWSCKPIFCGFESDRFSQVWLYMVRSRFLNILGISEPCQKKSDLVAWEQQIQLSACVYAAAASVKISFI